MRKGVVYLAITIDQHCAVCHDMNTKIYSKGVLVSNTNENFPLFPLIIQAVTTMFYHNNPQ